jgi:hypothetical protein
VGDEEWRRNRRGDSCACVCAVRCGRCVLCVVVAVIVVVVVDETPSTSMAAATPKTDEEGDREIDRQAERKRR